MTDWEAYELYREDVIWYNKLYVARSLGYNAGYGFIPSDGLYVIKPMVNLDGCGFGAEVDWYKRGDIVPEKYFWSEFFYGRHITIDYTKVDGQWIQGDTFEGFKDLPIDMRKFNSWCRTQFPYKLSDVFNEIQTDKLNIEIIGEKIIEVHLRHNTDPIQYDRFIPIWDETQICPDGYVRIQDKENHPGRLGFFVENKSNNIERKENVTQQ